MSTDDIGEGLGPMTPDTKPDLTGTGDLIKRLRTPGVQAKWGPPITSEAADAIEALADALEAAERENSVMLGVGDGDGHLFVHGDYDSIKVCQEKLFRMENAEAALAEARNALASIKAMKSTPIGDTGFAVGPRALLDAAQRIAKDYLASHATGQRQTIRLEIPPMPDGAPAAWGHRDPAKLYWLPVALKGPCAVTQWYVELPCGKTTIIDAEDHAELVPVSTGQRQGGDDTP